MFDPEEDERRIAEEEARRHEPSDDYDYDRAQDRYERHHLGW